MLREGAPGLVVEDTLDRLCADLPDTPNEHVLRVVATVYRYGYALGGSPTAMVMQRLRLTRSKASRWIAMAREFGYLGPTQERRAGESRRRPEAQAAFDAATRRLAEANVLVEQLEAERRLLAPRSLPRGLVPAMSYEKDVEHDLIDEQIERAYRERAAAQVARDEAKAALYDEED